MKYLIIFLIAIVATTSADQAQNWAAAGNAWQPANHAPAGVQQQSVNATQSTKGSRTEDGQQSMNGTNEAPAAVQQQPSNATQSTNGTRTDDGQQSKNGTQTADRQQPAKGGERGNRLQDKDKAKGVSKPGNPQHLRNAHRQKGRRHRRHHPEPSEAMKNAKSANQTVEGNSTLPGNRTIAGNQNQTGNETQAPQNATSIQQQPSNATQSMNGTNEAPAAVQQQPSNATQSTNGTRTDNGQQSPNGTRTDDGQQSRNGTRTDDGQQSTNGTQSADRQQPGKRGEGVHLPPGQVKKGNIPFWISRPRGVNARPFVPNAKNPVVS